MRCCRRLNSHPAAVAMAAGTTQHQEEPQPSLPPEQPVYLKPSSSLRRKSSFLFTRMREEPPSYAIRAPPLGTALPLFRIASSSGEYYAVRLPLVKAGFKRVPTQSHPTIPSNLLWGRSIPLNTAANMSSPSFSSLLSCSPPDVDTDVDLIALPMPTAATSKLAGCFNSLGMVCRHQRYNHFPCSYGHVGCKWGLTKSLRRMSKKLETTGDKHRRYGFFPRTWIYPDEKEAVMKSLAEAPPTQRFIWKPARGSCGHGIVTCMGGAKNAPYWERVAAEIDRRLYDETSITSVGTRKYVVQEYIEDPLLLDGRKTDLRLYVAVTNYDPLTVYLHEEGLVRLAAQEYNGGDRGSVLGFDPFRDLTNYTVGKRLHMRGKQSRAREGERVNVVADVSSDAEPPSPPQPELKKSLNELWEYIDDIYPQSPHAISPATLANAPPQRRMSEKVREEIARVVVKTLLAVKPSLTRATSNLSFLGGFFELYGFDLMLDAKLKPWLIEVNTLPSLASTSPLDYAVKTNVVADLLNLAMIEPFERPAVCFDDLGNEMPFTGILEPPTKETLEMVHRWSGDAIHDSAQLDDREAREEVRLRLQDELAYCGGFQRVFPPLPSTQRPSMMDELDILSSLVSLSKADFWALET